MSWMRRNHWILLTVIAALAVSAGAFVAHLHLDSAGHPESCAVCTAAHHGLAVQPAQAPIVLSLGTAPAARACIPAAPTPGHPASASPRAPPAT